MSIVAVMFSSWFFDANHFSQLLKCCGILAIYQVYQIFLHLIDSPTRQNCSCFIVICLLGILSSAIAFFCPHVNTWTESLCSVRIHHLLVAIDLGAGMINSSFTKPEKSFLESSQVTWSFSLCGWLCRRNRTSQTTQLFRSFFQYCFHQMEARIEKVGGLTIPSDTFFLYVCSCNTIKEYYWVLSWLIVFCIFSV